MFRKYFFEVLFSVGLVVVAVAISSFNPLIAGIFAVLPIRVGTSLFIIGKTNGTDALREAVLGSMYGLLGSIIFVATLYLFMGRYQPNTAFLLSSFLCLLYIAIILAGKKYGIV